jgi:hypothetical protein
VNPYGGAYRGRDAIVENVFGPILAETEQRNRGVRPDFASRARALRWAGGARILDRA